MNAVHILCEFSVRGIGWSVQWVAIVTGRTETVMTTVRMPVFLRPYDCPCRNEPAKIYDVEFYLTWILPNGRYIRTGWFVSMGHYVSAQGGGLYIEAVHTSIDYRSSLLFH